MLEGSLCKKMSTKDKNNLTVFKNPNHNNNQFSLIDFLRDNSVIFTIASAALILYLAIHDFQKDVDYLKDNMATKESVNNLLDKYTGLKDDYNNLNQKFDIQYKEISDNLDNLEDDYHILDKEIGIIQATNITYKGLATPTFQKMATYFTEKDGVTSLTNDLWNDTDIICNNEEENFSTEELINKKLLLSYIQDNQEIYFYGQYSSNKRWDGNCIINIYENNKLKLVTEALYSDGELNSYQQVFTYFTSAQEEVWCISQRECTKEGNIGDSWNYYKNSDLEKDFTIDSVEPYNIYNVAQVKKIIKEELECQIEAFYHGKTAGGLYNDQKDKDEEVKKEESYLVKFSKEDGTVRTLYFGDFVDGKLCDKTGNAWMIGRDTEKIGSSYSFYKGKFENNNPIDIWTPENSEKNLSLETINQKIEFKFIKPVLKWYGFNFL